VTVSAAPGTTINLNRRLATVADRDEVLKSPDKYDGHDRKFEDVTITGTSQGKQEKFLWLEVKTGAGKVVQTATRGQTLTFVIAKTDTPESISQMKPSTSISATLTCHNGGHRKGKHWAAKVRQIKVQMNK
jgi:hypothetical protein